MKKEVDSVPIDISRLEKKRLGKPTDTTAETAREQRLRISQMTPDERLLMASGMYDLAREIILSTLPAGLSEPERNYRLFIRMHGAAFEPLARQAFLQPR